LTVISSRELGEWRVFYELERDAKAPAAANGQGGKGKVNTRGL
jgi:hypothetical protein